MTIKQSAAFEDAEADVSLSVLLTYQELAVWLNDSVRYLRRLVEEQQIPYLKIGHFIRLMSRTYEIGSQQIVMAA